MVKCTSCKLDYQTKNKPKKKKNMSEEEQKPITDLYEKQKQ